MTNIIYGMKYLRIKVSIGGSIWLRTFKEGNQACYQIDANQAKTCLMKRPFKLTLRRDDKG